MRGRPAERPGGADRRVIAAVAVGTFIEIYDLAVAIVNAAGNLGAATAAAIGFGLARLLPPGELAAWGWRVPFLAAAVIGLVGLYLRTRVLDSPAFTALGEALG